MNEVLDKVSTLTVIKRNGKKVDFDGSKIALAIKKGFDHFIITNGDDEEKKYTEEDIQKVYKEVINNIFNIYLLVLLIQLHHYLPTYLIFLHVFFLTFHLFVLLFLLYDFLNID